MLNLEGMVYRVGAVRPDISSALHLNALQVAARRLCRETLRLRARVSIPVTNASFTKGWNNETFLTPDLQAHTPVLEDGPDSEAKKYGSLAVLDARLSRSSDGAVLPLSAQDLPSLRTYMDRVGPSNNPTSVSRVWADANGTVMIFPGFQESLGYDTLDLQLAISPWDNEMKQIQLPNDYEDALIEFALSVAYEFAGKGQSLDASKSHQNRALNLTAGLKTMNMIGSSGQPGRRLTPFDVTIRTRW